MPAKHWPGHDLHRHDCGDEGDELLTTRVTAIDVSGDTTVYAAPTVDYPTETVPSAPSAASNGVAM
jgi:hypothetical protein